MALLSSNLGNIVSHATSSKVGVNSLPHAAKNVWVSQLRRDSKKKSLRSEWFLVNERSFEQSRPFLTLTTNIFVETPGMANTFWH